MIPNFNRFVVQEEDRKTMDSIIRIGTASEPTKLARYICKQTNSPRRADVHKEKPVKDVQHWGIKCVALLNN